MKAIVTTAITLLFALNLSAQKAGIVDPAVVKANKVKSHTEWYNGTERGTTFHYNKEGQLTHYKYYASTFNSTGKEIKGDFGKHSYEYDSKGNLVLEKKSVYEPALDSTVFIHQINYFYNDDNVLIKKVHFDKPSKVSLTVDYFYEGNKLVKQVRTKPDSALIASTGERFLKQSTLFEYDKKDRLIAKKSYRESTLIERATCKYDGNTSTWKTTYLESGKTVTIVMTKDSEGRLTEKTTNRQSTYKLTYLPNGLVEKAEIVKGAPESSASWVFKYEFY